MEVQVVLGALVSLGSHPILLSCIPDWARVCLWNKLMHQHALRIAWQGLEVQVVLGALVSLGSHPILALLHL